MKLALSLLLAFATAISARPTPWSEDLLDEISALRAKGLTEQDIQFQHPVHITVSDRNQPIHHASTMVATSAPVRDNFTPTLMEGDDSGMLTRLVAVLCRKVTLMRGHRNDAATAGAPQGVNAEKDDAKSKKADHHEQHIEIPKLKNGVGMRGEEM